MPAYNAEKTLKKTVSDIPVGVVDKIILVDDFSYDRTVRLSKRLNIHTFRHKKNMGYGANQKTCYKLALKEKPDIVVMLHPDYQYNPKLITHFVDIIRAGYFDVMLGSRIRSRSEALAGGMPKYKYFSNRFLSFIANLVTGQSLTDWHTGMRAYRLEVLKNVKFQNNSNDFDFDSQFLFQIFQKGYTVGEIPVPVKYFKEASSINFPRSLKYGIKTLFYTAKYLLRIKI